MKKAIAIHGNLRTFLMPTRENGQPLYQNFLNNVINPNLDDELDVYISADINDFYHNGYQYYTEGSTIECTNNNSFRLYDKIKIVNVDDAKEIIKGELRRIIPNIKYLNIVHGFDATSHPAYEKIVNSGMAGLGAEPLINQNYKIYDIYKAIKNSEEKYDAILRTRFDCLYNGSFDLNKYDFHDGVIYTPGTKSMLCFDWYMLGNQRNMEIFMSMYERLGYTTGYQSWLLECSGCGTRNVEVWDREKNPREGSMCPFCKRNGSHFSDVTISLEYHIGRQAVISGISPQYSGVHAAVYRYDDVSKDNPDKLESILSSAEIKGHKFVNYSVDPRSKGERIL
jgi:hypothetical protein